jgi:hypothetical protein
MFADEAGNFDFRTTPGATQYFIIGSVTMADCAGGQQLMDLRRELAWQGVALESTFHATEDTQLVRDEVFRLLQPLDFRIDATILEKRKTQPHIQAKKEYFYKLAWHLHWKWVGPRILKPKDELLVIAASIGTKKRQKAVRLGIADVVVQSAPVSQWEVAFWPSNSDPCLQIADYCTWAIQRKWEKGDTRSYDLIKDKIKTEYDIWQYGDTYYY